MAPDETGRLVPDPASLGLVANGRKAPQTEPSRQSGSLTPFSTLAGNLSTGTAACASSTDFDPRPLRTSFCQRAIVHLFYADGR